MATVAQLNVEIAARIGELQKGLSAAQRELRNAGKQFGVAGKKAGEEFSKNLSSSVTNSVSSLSGIGDSLTQNITLPLAIMGGAAIQAAGKFESLRLAMQSTFQNAGRSISDANQEVEALRKAALAPGLDFQQAVSASIRLQAVGLSAEKARNVITELANAVASTGGTAENLSSVTVQMSQMISKGRVLAQDLRIIQENLPIVSTLMQKAFGTSNSEDIQKLGITGKQFVEGITVEMAKLARVEGGISNAIVNAGSAISQFLASIGSELNKVFSVGEKSDQFAAFLQDTAKWFSGLSNSTKQLAAEFALALLAAGPLVKVFSVLSSGAGQLVNGFRIAGAAIQSLNAGMSAMEAAAIRVRVALGIIGIVAALGVAIYTLSDSFDAATFASDKFQEAQKGIISETSKEIGAVNQLFDAIKDETKGRGERGQSIDKLLKLYPDYFKGMDLEGASVARLTELQNGLNKSILRGVAERKKAEAVNAIYEKQAEIITRIQQIREGSAVTASEAGLIDTGDMIRAGSRAEAVILKMQAQAEELGNQVGVVSGQFERAFGAMNVAIDPVLKKEYDLRDAYMAEKEAHQQGLLVTKEDTKERKENAGAISEQSKKAKILKEVLSDVSNATETARLLGEDEDIAKLEELQKGIKKLIDAGFKPASAEVQNLKAQLDALTAKPNDIVINVIRTGGGISPVSSESAPGGLPSAPTPDNSRAVELAREEFERREQLAQEWKDTYLGITQQAVAGAAQIFDNATNAKRDKDLAQLEAEGKVRLANAKGNAALEASIQADLDRKRAAIEKKASLRKKIAALGEAAINIAVGITKAIASAPPPLNIPAIIATAAQGAIQLGVIASQKFAAGTRDAPGGLALVGERGPELVNLPKHSQVFNAGVTSTALRGGQNLHITGEFVARGTEMALVIDRSRAKENRFK
jgi:tape measure domain-containing protein